MSKLEVAFLVGPESKQWLERFEAGLDRMEKLTAKATNAKTGGSEDEEETFMTKKTTSKKKAVTSFDEEEEDSDEFSASDLAGENDDTDEEEEVAPPKKAAKPKKLTLDDVADACKAKASASNRNEVKAILKKKFGVDSITDLDTDQYADVIKAMK